MNQKKQSLQEQILKLLEGKSTRGEAEEFLQMPSEVLDGFLDEKEWNELSPGRVPQEWSESWLENINRKKVVRVRRLTWKYLSRAAVIVLLGTCAAMYLFKNTLHKQQPETSIAEAEKLSQRDTIVQNTGNTPLKYTLPDHSIVTLSPGSTLRYNLLMQNDRVLWLDGEGIFDVVHDNQRPFRVYTEGLVTTDLGTVFKITAYKERRSAQVKLISGEVSVHRLSDTSKVFYLTAGQSCRFNLADQSLQLMPEEREKMLTASGRKNEKIISEEEVISFHNTPLPQVLQQLSKIYHTNIEFSEDSLKSRKFTGSFNKHTKLENVIESLLLVNDLISNQTGDTIHISTK